MAGPAGWLARLRDLAGARRWAVVASAIWVVVVTGYALGYLGTTAGAQARGMVFLDGLLFLIALILPLILVWLAAYLAEEMARQREIVSALAEAAAPLYQALEATRAVIDAKGSVAPVHDVERDSGATDRRIDALADLMEGLAAGQARLQAQIDSAAFSVRDTPGIAELEAQPPITRTEPSPAPEPAPLPLLPEAVAVAPLDWPDLIRAMNFPRDGSDREGFRALEAALRHPPLAQMLQAAEDVLTMLSQDGVYMEDLPVAPVEADAWRRFIAGTRGADVAGLGGITDEAALAAGRDLLKTDPIFRDTALFFQRRFDGILIDYVHRATDSELAELADTRSGRAFMLLARLSGSLG